MLEKFLSKEVLMAALRAAIIAGLGVILEALTSVSQVAETLPGV